MTLGEKIKFLRIKKGITQETFAEKLNVSRSAIAKWETNGGVPEISNLKMISQIFDVSIDELLDEKRRIDTSDVREKKTYDCSEYSGHYYNIELNGWNDGVSDVLILGEDKDFLFYQKSGKKRNICGLIGKKFITSVEISKKSNILLNDDIIDRDYFCAKHVLVEIACKEGFFKGFFDFRNDDYVDVVINSFQDSKILLKFGKEINIDTITKIEELDV